MFVGYFLALLNRSNALDEIDLIRRIIQRDEKALGALYDRYAKLLFSFILSVVKKQEEAEDVLQELFVQIWEKASSFDVNRGNVYTWLFTLARNRAIDRLRSKQHRAEGRSDPDFQIELIPNPLDPSPFDAVVMREQAETVRTALQNIPQDQREVIQIAYFGGLSQSEIAASLNVPLGTVKTRMRQGMKKLLNQLRGLEKV